MSIVSLDATHVASRRRAPRIKSLDVLAAELISAGYIYDDHYLEMKHLDPKWMMAIYIYWLALYKALGGEPSPVSKLDRS
jgi:hypothetical protein